MPASALRCFNFSFARARSTTPPSATPTTRPVLVPEPLGGGVGAGVGGGWHVADPAIDIQPRPRWAQAVHWLASPRPYVFAGHGRQVAFASKAPVLFEAYPGAHRMAAHCAPSPEE